MENIKSEHDDDDLTEALNEYEYIPEDEYEDESDTAYNEFSVLGVKPTYIITIKIVC